ncbi:DNA-binding protein [Nostoc punctiforme NIES-2108]|uniref:DNA-binding protein n=1 Tax=Nostoc punctiforme NIES-2108 TaxID=1356359 RepID=A0A367QYA8_NOSPU|nr:DNA-binding protein [Nostoc punctiforme NIES-2108]
MNKSELVDTVATKTSIIKKPTDEVIIAFLSVVTVITEALANGDKVTLVGFGSFERRVACRRRHRSNREGRNPKTNEPMIIPATRVPAFFPGKQCREKVAP